MNVNVRPDMLRQGGAPPGMLGVGPPFMQGMPPAGQQQLPSTHLGLPSNPNGPNSAMMHNNNPAPISAAQQQRYQALQQQHQEARQRQMQQMRQAAANQHMMGPAGSSMSAGGGAPPHIAALAHNQGMSFNPSMMSQPPGSNVVRRVSSQPSMNPGPGSLGGISPNLANNSLSMGMNPPANMAQPQIRQITPQMQHQLRMQHQAQLQSQLGADMPLTMNRPVGNPPMPPGRTGPQPMNSLSQPTSMPQQMGLHQNQFQNSMQISSQHHPPQIPSPRAGSHTPNMSMATPGPSQTPANRPQMNPEDSPMAFMNFSNPQFPQSHNPSRMPQSNGQFPPFVAPSGSPIPMSDISQPMSAGLGASGNPSRPGFHLTPAQQFEQMNASLESYPSHFSMPPPSHVPPRPPSHGSAHPPLPQQHPVRHSPHPPDPHMAPQPPRPHSQPQAIPRPPSQQRPHTPRSAHPQIQPGPPPPSGNRGGMQSHGPPQPGQQMPVSGPNQPMSMASRPPPAPQLHPPTAGPSNVPPSSLTDGLGPSDAQPPAPGPIQRPPNTQPMSSGTGQGLTRLLQFSGVLSSENQQKLQLSYWNDIITEYFTPRAIMKFTFWKDSQRGEAKVFDIGVPILPRFFLVTTQSGVKSMTLSLDGARERVYSSGHTIVECVGAVWTYKYNNGYTVVLRGPLTAHVVLTAPFPPGTSQSTPSSSGMMFRFEDFQFDANSHEKYISLESIMGTRVTVSPNLRVRGASTPTPNGNTNQQSQHQQQLEDDKRWEEPRITIERASMPGEPVNAFGIPQATMRCLELAESVAQMGELITFSTDSSLGPLEALKKYAAKIKEIHAVNPLPPMPPPNSLVNGAHPNLSNPSIHPFTSIHSNSSVPPTPAVTLYSSAPASVTNPPPNSASTSTPMTSSPKNAPASASNSPQKQHKTIPTQQQQQAQATPSSSSTVVTSPTVSSGATTNTPALSSASLKRKHGPGSTSPTTTTNEPASKRPARKRRTTNPAGNAG